MRLEFSIDEVRFPDVDHRLPVEELQMHDYARTTVDSGTLLSSSIAELADAAYLILLHSGVRGSWMDLKLDVWRVLADTINRHLETVSWFNRHIDEMKPWREDVLADLADVAYRTGIRHGLQGSFLQVQLELRRALCPLIDRLPVGHFVATRRWPMRPGLRN